MLEIENLKAGYGRITVLQGVNLQVKAGEYLGVLGHNGMGKSTLLRTLIGILPAQGGQIRYQGEDITRLPTHLRVRRRLGYVPQGRDIFPALSVRENLQLAAVRSPGEVVDEIIEEFPRLKPLLDRPGGALSGGEQQILALARCLCTQPQLILLDEPTEGIQPSIIEQMIDSLAAMRRSRDLTMILVEQNLDFLVSLSDRIAVLEKGRVTHIHDGSQPGGLHALMSTAGFGTDPTANTAPPHTNV